VCEKRERREREKERKKIAARLSLTSSSAVSLLVTIQQFLIWEKFTLRGEEQEKEGVCLRQEQESFMIFLQ
jgi:hypothetical protein